MDVENIKDELFRSLGIPPKIIYASTPAYSGAALAYDIMKKQIEELRKRAQEQLTAILVNVQDPLDAEGKQILQKSW